MIFPLLPWCVWLPLICRRHHWPAISHVLHARLKQNSSTWECCMQPLNRSDGGNGRNSCRAAVLPPHPLHPHPSYNRNKNTFAHRTKQRQHMTMTPPQKSAHNNTDNKYELPLPHAPPPPAPPLFLTHTLCTFHQWQGESPNTSLPLCKMPAFHSRLANAPKILTVYRVCRFKELGTTSPVNYEHTWNMCTNVLTTRPASLYDASSVPTLSCNTFQIPTWNFPVKNSDSCFCSSPYQNHI